MRNVKIKVIYNCIKKTDIVPTQIYKWIEELSPHRLDSIVNVF